MTEDYGNDSHYCSRTAVEKSATANEYEYGTFGVLGVDPSLGRGAEGCRTRVQGRRGSVTKYSFEIQEASLSVAVDALVLNADTYRDQLSSRTASSSSILGTTFSSERSIKEVPTQMTHNGC